MELVWGQGPAPCAGLILGEAPGENEEKEGVPFVGLSGKLLNEALEAAGISRDQVYVTNAYKLRPENNRTPTEEELYEHSEFLNRELDIVRPDFVLTLGNVAMGAMTGEFNGITRLHGKWIDGPFDAVMVLPAYHPSYVLRQGGRDTFAGSEFFADVATFVQAAFA